jgi:uncharacterized membrane protein (DUF373 family)
MGEAHDSGSPEKERGKPGRLIRNSCQTSEELYIPKEPFIQRLRSAIHFAVRVLAVLMTLVIFWGVLDVGWVIYRQLMEPPFMMLTISDILATFGAFMAVLIAIEIFINITIYLREDVIHVRIVMATALMAIARKVIILDFDKVTPDYIWSTAAVILAMSIGYWLVIRLPECMQETGAVNGNSSTQNTASDERRGAGTDPDDRPNTSG